MRTRLPAIALSLLLVAFLVPAASPASTLYVGGGGPVIDFESAPGGDYTLAADGAGQATQSSEQAHGGTHSAKLDLPDGTTDFAKVIIPISGQLRNASATFWTYLPTQTVTNLIPYMYFGVDANMNGVFDFGGPGGGDSFVIAFITGSGSYSQNTWLQSGLDASTVVHVVGNRSGLAAGEFSSSNGGGLFSDLITHVFSGSTTWGDLVLMEGRVGAGEWPGVGAFTAYVDDVSISACFSTVQAGVTAAVSGDVVLVAPGTYTENVTLNKQLTLLGAQHGVGACGRMATESILTGTGTLLRLVTGSAGAVIDGFTFSGGSKGLESTSGPINGIQILNNRFVGFTGNGVFLNDNGTEITAHQNLIDGSSAVGSGDMFHLDQDNFDGFYLTDNCIQNGLNGTGFFVDGNHNVDNSSGTRNPVITGNLFQGCGTGVNLGYRAFAYGTISGNTFRQNVYDGLQGGIQNSSISGNTFDQNGRYGLTLTSFGNSSDPTRGAKDCTVTGNGFTGNVAAGLFYSSSQYPGTISTNVAHQNNFAGNTVGVTYAGTEAIDAACNWWNDVGGPDAPPAHPNPGGDPVSGSTILYAPWLDAAVPGGSCDEYGSDFVAANTSGLCVSTEHPCVMVPIEVNRSDATPMRLFHVVFTLSPELALCDEMNSIVEGDYLSGFNPHTSFQKVDNGSGRYTVDCAILGTPCGPTASSGTLFTLNLHNSGADGSGTITINSVTFRDCNNGSIPGIPGAPATLDIDNTSPSAISDLFATQVKTGNDSDGTTKINLSFTPPTGGGYETTDIYRKGFGNYPEYDDAPGAGSVPSIPATPAAALSAGWVLAGSSGSGAFTDETTARDFYYYVAFSRDGCGNISSASNMPAGRLNYHLGDVHNGLADCAGNNLVNLSDVSFLGSHYGVALVPSDPYGCLDVGPTTDYSVNGRPLTDNVIDFEDLIMFAINYGTVSLTGPPAAGSLAEGGAFQEHPVLRIITEATQVRTVFNSRLVLEKNESATKGIHARVAYDPSKLEFLDATPGSLCQGQVFFKHLPDDSGVTVDVAVLGQGEVFSGSGEVAVLHFRARSANAMPALKSADLRDRDNHFLGDRPQGAGPVALAERTGAQAGETGPTVLLGARPNPFTGWTEIRFHLPKDAPVSLSIFDAGGRLIRTLEDGSVFQSGDHSVRWDGADGSGQTVGAGVYFYSFRAGQARETHKLFLYK